MKVTAIYELADALKHSWSEDTAYKHESVYCPEHNQCAVTALIVQDFLGGEILKNEMFNHYWNLLDNGTEVDLTRAQFPGVVALRYDRRVLREQLDRGDTRQRYRLLLAAVKKYLEENYTSETDEILVYQREEA